MFRRKDPVTRAKDVGKLEGVTFRQVPEWIAAALGMQVGAVPSRLLLPNIAPVLEVYQPRPRTIAVPDANGPIGFTIDVPDDKEWDWLSMSFLVETDATVASRELFVRVTKVIADLPITVADVFTTSGNFAQVASTRVFYTVAPSGVVGNVAAVGVPGVYNAIVHAPTPIGLKLFNRSSITVIMQNSVAGDFIDGIGFSVMERPAAESFAR